ncbi:BSD domain-containing protein 1-like [Centruroides sculpturatus]|uniref:BSD domain-containing protein 1-like n=1 Tax=Centruroides sculpturatus TaxID=218467 RepID=UPI000C6E02A8|nr:BSD domain-containing protein 1-like [Centruroides sculpturatus]
MSQLVPAAVSHVEFWQRYYYRVHLLKQTEAKRAELMKRAEIEIPKEETIWDDDDEFSEIATNSSSMIHVNSEKFKHPNKGESSKLLDNSSFIIDSETAIKKSNNSPSELYNETSSVQDRESLKIETEHDLKISEKSALSKELFQSQGEDNSQKILSDSICLVQSLGELQNVSTSSTVATESDKTELSLREIISREKGDMVVIGDKNTISPASSDTALKGSAEDSDLDKDCDWEKDFDLDITDEDLKKLENNNKNTRPKEIEEDWENWE